MVTFLKMSLVFFGNMGKYYFGQRERFENYFLGEIYMLTSKIKPIFSKS